MQSIVTYWSDFQSTHEVSILSSNSDLSSTEDEMEEEKSKNCDPIHPDSESDHSISSVSTVHFRHIDSVSSTDQTSSPGSP